jgi:hypothetical protein
MGYAGAMAADFLEHAVPVDGVKGILEVQADNDKVGGILLVCHQAVKGVDQPLSTSADTDTNLLWLQILTDSR